MSITDLLTNEEFKHLDSWLKKMQSKQYNNVQGVSIREKLTATQENGTTVEITSDDIRSVYHLGIELGKFRNSNTRLK